MKWWSRWVARPHQPACRAGALLVCHDPTKLAGRLGAAPSKLSFGDSVAQAGARPVENWCGCRELRPDFLRGGEVFLLLNHNRVLERSSRREEALMWPGRKWAGEKVGNILLRVLTFSLTRFPTAHFQNEPRHLGCYEEIEKAGSVHAPGPCHFNKEQTPPGDLLDPSPRFHGGCFGVWGTPPPKPLKCKTRSRFLCLPGRAATRPWAHHAGDESKLVFAKLSFATEDITWMSLCSRSQIIHPSLRPFASRLARKQKTLLARGKQGREILFRFVTCLPPVYPNCLRAVARHTARIG